MKMRNINCIHIRNETMCSHPERLRKLFGLSRYSLCMKIGDIGKCYCKYQEEHDKPSELPPKPPVNGYQPTGSEKPIAKIPEGGSGESNSLPKEANMKSCNIEFPGMCDYKTIGGTHPHCKYAGYCDYQVPKDTRNAEELNKILTEFILKESK